MKPFILISLFLIAAALPWACSNNPTNPYAAPTNTPTIAATLTNTPTGSFTPTQTPSKTPSSTATNSPTSTSTSTPSNTATTTPSSTPTLTATDSPTPTITDTPTITSTATNSPTLTPTDTPVPVGVTFGVLSPFPYHYAVGGVAVSAPVTISVGTSAVWDSSNGGIHPLYLDNGTSSCLIGGSLSFPLTQVLGVGTYHFHCGNHGACTNNLVCPNANCTGMAVTLVVQ